MNTPDIITSALAQGILAKETTFGIWSPAPCYSVQPANAERFRYREGMYHVTCDRSRSELLSGIRLMAERMKVELKGIPAR